jgi:hypothetical protein
MANKSKANLVGEVLRGLAYHDLDVGASGEPLVSDYSPGRLANSQRVFATAEEQTEQHVLLHHGLSPEGGVIVRDDWCFECTKQFLSHCLGSFSNDILEAAQRSGKVEKILAKEPVAALVIRALRTFDEHRDSKMREATAAVQSRGDIGPRAEELEALLKGWNEDADRVTDFYAAWLGKRYPAMIDRAEKLNAIPAREKVSEAVQRYLIEASKCYIFGQYIACLLVCRSALIFSLEDYLIREGKQPDLDALRANQDYAVGPLIRLARSLNKWRMKPTFDDAWEVGKQANAAVHVGAPGPELCRDLFIKTRGVLKELYA